MDRSHRFTFHNWEGVFKKLTHPGRMVQWYWCPVPSCLAKYLAKLHSTHTQSPRGKVVRERVDSCVQITIKVELGSRPAARIIIEKRKRVSKETSLVRKICYYQFTSPSRLFIIKENMQACRKWQINSYSIVLLQKIPVQTNENTTKAKRKTQLLPSKRVSSALSSARLMTRLVCFESRFF